MRFSFAFSILLLAACGGPGSVDGLPAGLAFETVDAIAVEHSEASVGITIGSAEMRCLDPWTVDSTGARFLLGATIDPANVEGSFELNRRPSIGSIQVSDYEAGVRIAGSFEASFNDLEIDGENFGTFTVSGDFDARFCP